VTERVKPQSDIKSGRLWIEEGEQRVGLVAEVAPILRMSRTYSFAVPLELEEGMTPGRRVRVPIGRTGRLVMGFVVGLDRRTWDMTLRPVDSFVDEQSFLSPHLIELGREISTHYACPLGTTLKAITPEGVRRQRGYKKIRYVHPFTPPDGFDQSAMRMTPGRRALFEVLSGLTEPTPLARVLEQAGVSAGVVASLKKLGMVRVEERREIVDADEADDSTPLVEPGFELNEEQWSGLETIGRTIEASRFMVTLLFGVSGSGKTEVYIRAMRRVLEQGRQAILLVPEIVLTTQLVQRLASRFADVAVHHSGLTESRRSILWRQVAEGKKNVVIGTRSAVFAPCPNLGLICVDEEQESSFKNLQAPRFHVRDVAIMRAKLLGIPVVLGSATPSIETWHLSGQRKDYQRVTIRHRVRSLPLPKVHLIDMRDEIAEMKRPVFMSRTMERLLGTALARGEQALILMNRRGFANRMFCPHCSTRITCPNCNVGLVVHSATGESICHYCRTRIKTPTVCPNVACGQPLMHVGIGTQRVEDILRQCFPEARIKRADSDTMRHRSYYVQLVEDFEARRIDILVGTQMIAKGLDFPFVSFVGVMHADAGAIGADFRAHERLFQLVTQVAGRAGRAEHAERGDASAFSGDSKHTGKGGVARSRSEVVVQTITPELPAFGFALNHDYEAFAEHELEARRRVGLPPFRRLARVVVAHKDERVTRDQAQAITERVLDGIRAIKLDHADVIGPNPCVLTRLRGKYRYDVVIRTYGASDLRRLLHHLQEAGAFRSKADVVIDVDPVEMA
jgi:primosomal protein N' (replication factor Y) (superfamily II helicase)